MPEIKSIVGHLGYLRRDRVFYVQQHLGVPMSAGNNFVSANETTK